MAEVILTKEQQAVVTDRGGALLVSAAAGSGKTKVLVDRVLARVTEEHKNVDEFLMITFTQAAAAELRGKLIAELSKRLAVDPENRHLQRQMNRVYLAQISTVHAFCGKLLRDYAHILDLPADFRVCDEQEAAALRSRVMRGILEEAYPKAAQEPELAAVLDMFGAGRDDHALPERIEKVYFSLQCYPEPAKQMLRWREMLDVSADTDAGQTVWGAYLMRELRYSLLSGIQTLEDACNLAERSGVLDAYLPVLRANANTLRALTEVETWEELHTQQLDFGRMPVIRKCSDPETQERVKSARKRVIENVRRWMEKFSLPSDEALADLRVSGTALRGLLRLSERFSVCYREEKLRRHLLDYNDLEHDALRLLRRHDGAPTAAAREISERFAEIMVDEYQDTNRVQDSIFSAISRNGQNVFMVGDVKQSIYRFRMADPTIFLEKYKTFSNYTEASDGEPRKILLSDNFRSHPEILSAANDVFRLTMTERVGGLRYGSAEALRPKRSLPDMGAPAVELHCIDMQTVSQEPPVDRAEIEAEFIADRIEALLNGTEKIPENDDLRPIQPEDIVILMRSLSGKASIYMQSLRRRGIQSVCGSDDLFEAEEIQFLTALLQLIDNPHQDIPLLCVLLSPVAGFTANDLAMIRAGNRRGDLYDALCAVDQAREFLSLLGNLRELSHMVTIRELLDEIDERMLLRTVYGSMQGGGQRIRNLDVFSGLADNYERSERRGLTGFLRYLDGLRDKGVAADDSGMAGAVRLMTVHKSKGLEFPVVFLADLSKRFNHMDARDAVLVDTELGLGAAVYDMYRHISYPTIARNAIADRIDKESISEEMRVLYVAMTRAKYRLILSCCTRRLIPKLTSIARDLTIPVSDALIEGADSMGDWILMTAMTRTEAGELFAVSGNTECSSVSEHPWHIRLHDGANYLSKGRIGEKEPEIQQNVKYLEPMLDFSYPYKSATTAPTKLTATQLKGRNLDEEVAENAAVQAPLLHFPKPQFVNGLRPLTPAERGTAIHLAMQHLCFEQCATMEGIQGELQRLKERKFLTEQQLMAIPPEKILRFFTSQLGQLVLSAEHVVREFKFSVLEDAAVYDDALRGEQVLLQGVTDCCIVEPTGLTVLDFKTDHVVQGREEEQAEFYRGQLNAYGRALSKIFALPIKARVLYFFATDTAYWL